MKLSQVAKIVAGNLQGSDCDFNSISIDSRSIKSGELFLALSGENFDGHNFVEKAAQNGAAAAIVSTDINTTLPLLKVKNTHQALMRWAAAHRQEMPADIIAVTGSCGKTTTRAMLESVFSLQGKIIASEKSYNNNIGVPLTLLRLTPDIQFCICEMGANHIGEIAELTQIVTPNVAIITNAASAHLEGFGSLDGVAKAKGEIYSGLKANGVAVINIDDHYADYWKSLNATKKIITFGLSDSADIRAQNIQFNSQAHPSFELITPIGNTHIQLKVMGEHNVMNALAVTAAALAQNIGLEVIARGLQSSTAVVRRLCEKGFAGATIIDDSYNANPFSVTAAMDVLVKKSGHKILVLGDMKELGSQAEQLHAEIGKAAAKKGIDKLYGYGSLSQHTVQAFGKNGFYFQNQEELLKKLKNDLSDQVTVLIKGSNSMHMDLIVAALMKG